MESDEDVVEAEAEEVATEPLPRWLALVAIVLVVGSIAAVFGWSALWRPDADAWATVKCRVEAARAWPRDDVQHRVVYARCIEQLP